jgi:UPF0271 protein
VSYVKPHGALYNRIVRDDAQAAAVVGAVRAYDARLPLLGLPGSRVLALAAEAGLPTVTEAFADRAYLPDGRLAPRSQPGAVLDSEAAAAQGLRLAREGEVDSICIHGDSPGAPAVARAVREALAGSGIETGPLRR